MESKKFLPFVLLAILFALTACGIEKEDDIKNKSEILKIAVSDIGTGNLHPAYAETDGEKYMVDMVFEPLIKINKDGEIVPVLAKSYAFTEDKKSVIFYLRDDVYWHSGFKFTSRDVKFTLEFLSSSDYRGIADVERNKGNEADFIKSIDVVDQYTIKISTEDVYAPFLEKISGIYIFPEYQWNFYNDNVPDYTEVLENPVGTGRYVMESYVPGQQINFIRNESYWGEKHETKKAVLIATDYNNAKFMLLNGEVDIMSDVSVDESDVAAYDKKDIKTYNTGVIKSEQVILNNENKYLKDKAFRQAMMYAIDRRSFIKCLFGNDRNIMNTCYPVNYPYYSKNSSPNSYEYDPQKAVELLTEVLGYEYTEGIMYDEGQKIKLTLIYSASNKLSKLCPPVIQENLNNIGIEVETRYVYSEELISCLKSGSYDMAMYETTISKDPDISDMFHSDSISYGENYSRYANPALNYLIEEGCRYYDHNMRYSVYEEAARVLNDEVPVLFLFDLTEILLSNVEI